jgi:hypothetical protein
MTESLLDRENVRNPNKFAGTVCRTRNVEANRRNPGATRTGSPRAINNADGERGYAPHDETR